MSNPASKQKTYDDLSRALGQCGVMFDLIVDAQREIVERIDAAGDSPAKLVEAVSGLSTVNAHLDLLLVVASKARQRMVLAHGDILREQWQALHAELQGGGLDAARQQALQAQIMECRMAAAVYADPCDIGTVDPLTIDYTKAATKAARDIFEQMNGALIRKDKEQNE